MRSMECIIWSIIIYKYRHSSYSIRRTAYLRALGATPTRAPLREALKKAVRAAEAANMMLVDGFFCGEGEDGKLSVMVTEVTNGGNSPARLQLHKTALAPT